jgi:HNH endonuclease
MLTQQDVRRLFNYDPLTGVLTWRVRSSRRLHVGDRAGFEDYQKDGSPRRRQVRIDNASYNEAHVIWLWMTGTLPIDKIDHIDLNPFNNSWSNLREADASGNTANGRNRRPGRLKWTYLQSSGRYQAQVRSKGVLHCLGSYDTEQEAHAAAYVVAKQLHGRFVRRK